MSPTTPPPEGLLRFDPVGVASPETWGRKPGMSEDIPEDPDDLFAYWDSILESGEAPSIFAQSDPQAQYNRLEIACTKFLDALNECGEHNALTTLEASALLRVLADDIDAANYGTARELIQQTQERL